MEKEFGKAGVQKLVQEAIEEQLPKEEPPESLQSLHPAPMNEKILELTLVDALCNVKSHVAMARFMAVVSVRTYRYMPAIGKEGGGFQLMRYNGATYEKMTGSANMDCDARDTTDGILKSLMDRLTPPPADEEEVVADEEEVVTDEEEINYSELYRRVAQMKHLLGNATYWCNVKRMMHEMMVTDKFYTSRELPSPKDFFLSLDSNADLLGFRNGVMNMRDPETGGVRFYPKGKVPRAYAVSMSVGFEYKGNEDGTPRDEEQQREMQEVEEKVRRMFPADAMWKTARLVYGCILYGGNGATRAAIQQLGPTSNGKTKSEVFLTSGLGSQSAGGYAGTFKKALIIKTQKEADEAAPTHALYRIYRLRVAFCSETGENDEPNDDLKHWTGGGLGIIRAMYLSQFEAPVLPKFFISSNYPLKHDSNDAAWASPAYGRFRTSLSFEAMFRKDITMDDPEHGIYVGDDGDELDKFYNSRRHGALLLLVKFAKEFAAGGFKMPLTPDSIAKSRLHAAGSCAGFVAYVKENYDSTELPGSKPGAAADYAAHGKDAAMHWHDIFAAYKMANPEDNIPKKSAKKALAVHLGYEPKAVNGHGIKGLGVNGVLLRRKPQNESDN